ncbi:type VII secretion target [Nocardia sp. NPDC050710]|uniref:type VII secretion target n=1 Tax=Nocardia sp. NPDC050710 TaxID=3157220 RepID=UPI00340ADC21
MPDQYLDIDPSVLRQLANQHFQVARDTREWARQPTEWLNSFPDTYGDIADPVYNALKSYYKAREDAGNALADEHDDTGRNLLAAAAAYEEDDNEIGRQIRVGGNLVEHGGLGDPGMSPPPPTTPPTPPQGPTAPIGEVPGGQPPTTVRPGPDTDTPPVVGAPGGGGSTTPVGTGAPAGTGMPTATGMPSTAVPFGTDGTGPATGTGAGSGVTAPTAGGMPPASAVPGATMPPSFGSGDERTSTPPAAGSSSAADVTPVPVPPSFGAAVAAAKDKEAEPAYVVGADVDEDLVLARTLLSAVLAAADEPVVGLAWAVAVLRGPAGTGVFITSNEGRGWLPAGLFLPQQVSTPWIWDELLGVDGTGSPWEGVSDPARILTEFALAWGPKANARMSALVSSGPIDTGLRARLSDVAMEGLVGPAYEVDLRVLTHDTTDRLGIVGSPSALEQIAAVPDSAVRARAIELASDAHAQVGRSVPSSPETAAPRAVRERILTAIQAGQQVPRALWDELRDENDLLAASMLSRRIDVGRVELGELRVDEQGAGLRAMVFERRSNELVLLLEGESTRQSLRDAIYAHEQIVNHPLFVAVPAAVSTTETDRVVRPTAGTGAVSAPAVTAGPPSGAVVAPVTSPPGGPRNIAPDRR